jgi:hypothetical protein
MLGTRFDDRRQDTRLAVVVQRAISIERAMGFVKATRYLVERGATNELVRRMLLAPLIPPIRSLEAVCKPGVEKETITSSVSVA